MRQNHTISIHFAKAVLTFFRDDLSCTETFLTSVGISAALFDNPRARITPQQLSRLIKLVSRQLNDEFLGLATRPMPLGSFSLLARNAIHSKNLFQVYKNTELALKSMTKQLALQLIVIEEKAHIRFDIQGFDQQAAMILTELVLLIWHRFPSWLSSTVLPLVEVCLPFAKPAHADEYHLLFATKISYNCAVAELVIPAQFVDLPCRRTLAELEQYISELPEYWFKRMDYSAAENDISSACLKTMERLSCTDMAAIAQKMNKSVRTLRRNLAAESASFQQLKAQYLRDKAIHLLTNTKMTMENIANILGYTEASAFTRAFKQWTGSTPKDYRYSI